MKHVFALLIFLIITSSCATLSSLDDLNCQLSTNRSQNFVGKWKVSTRDKKFVWRFYKDNRSATLANEYLTQIFDQQVYISEWENNKIDTLKVFYNSALASGPLQYLILSNQCREIIMVNTKTRDTLTLKRKQYFYQ